jgi:hypothetical protein
VPGDALLAKKLQEAAAAQTKWLRARDELIRQAHAEGFSLREIGALVGLSHVGVMKIASKTGEIPQAQTGPFNRDRVRRPLTESEFRKFQEEGHDSSSPTPS